MPDLLAPLNDLPLAGLMLVVAVGFAVGRRRFRGFALGPAGGTLFVAILAGSLGLDYGAIYGGANPKLTLGSLGFALFLYSVGFEAGPRFFSSLVGGSVWRFALAGLTVVFLAAVAAVLCGRLLGLGPSVAAGILAGALTSAPTYAAAAEIGRDPSALAVAFALTYPFGLLGVVLLVQYLPRLMGDDLAADASPDDEPGEIERRARGPELTRAFEVLRPGAVGKALRELALPRETGCYVTRLLRGDEVRVPDADTVLMQGDHVMAKGRLEELARFAELVGPEVYDDALRRRLPPPRRVQVLSPSAIGRSLGQLDMARRLGALVTGIDRGGIEVEPGAEVVVERGDVLEVTGRPEAVRSAAREVGRFERPSHETDVAIYAGGIFLGLLLGRLHLAVGRVDLRIGTATGLLAAGMLLGRFQRIGPFTAHVPRAARQLVRDLGILLFVAETGVRAGGSDLSGLHAAVLPTVLAGAVTALVPVTAAVLVARRLLGLRAGDAWGSVCGGMTSSAALVALRSAADSNDPALPYTAAYAVGSIFVTLAGPAVVLLAG